MDGILRQEIFTPAGNPQLVNLPDRRTMILMHGMLEDPVLLKNLIRFEEVEADRVRVSYSLTNSFIRVYHAYRAHVYAYVYSCAI